MAKGDFFGAAGAGDSICDVAGGGAGQLELERLLAPWLDSVAAPVGLKAVAQTLLADPPCAHQAACATSLYLQSEFSFARCGSCQKSRWSWEVLL